MSYLDQLNDKRQATTQRTKEEQDLGAMVRELQKIQMATAAFQSKPSVVLTDQTDLGDKIKELTDKLTSAVQSTDTTKLSEDQLEQLKTLDKGLETLTKAIYMTHNDNKGSNSDLLKALKGLDLKPVVNIPAPIVNVEAKDIDFSPITATLKEHFTAPKADTIDLECYRAQDIKDSGDIQYVGFVNPKGHWYIIENDTKKNTMRYAFGSDDYAKHFRNASRFVYRLLNEALSSAKA